MLRRLLFLKFVPRNRDMGLLVMRVIVSLSILLKHGLGMLFDFQTTYVRIESIHHYLDGVGMVPSLVAAAIADGILTILLCFGLATRWCALFCLITLAGAWCIHGFAYFTSDMATRGEMIFVYMIALFGLLLSGGGQYSLDAWIDCKRQ